MTFIWLHLTSLDQNPTFHWYWHTKQKQIFPLENFWTYPRPVLHLESNDVMLSKWSTNGGGIQNISRGKIYFCFMCEGHQGQCLIAWQTVQIYTSYKSIHNLFVMLSFHYKLETTENSFANVKRSHSNCWLPNLKPKFRIWWPVKSKSLTDTIVFAAITNLLWNTKYSKGFKCKASWDANGNIMNAFVNTFEAYRNL